MRKTGVPFLADTRKTGYPPGEASPKSIIRRGFTPPAG